MKSINPLWEGSETLLYPINIFMKYCMSLNKSDSKTDFFLFFSDRTKEDVPG